MKSGWLEASENMATASRVTMSFSLCAVIAEAFQKTANPAQPGWTGAMRPAMHGQNWVLGLHSCRALSPQSRKNGSTDALWSSSPKMSKACFITGCGAGSRVGGFESNNAALYHLIPNPKML
jgi:hypothetical protein